MAKFGLGKLASELGKLVPELTLFHYRGEQCLDEIFEWVWDNKQFDCKALEESGKSEETANMLRLLGNESYKAQNYAEALSFYNQSIVAAPHPVLSNVKIEEADDGEFGFPRIDPARYGGVAVGKCSALGKGFANRSAVMLDIGEYEKCLADIARALEYGYPEELRPKLEARRLKCQESQRKEKISYDTRRSFVDERLESSTLKECLRQEKLYQAGKPPALPPVLKDPNPCIPACSSAVKVSYWPNKGRGLVAARDIKPGEILGVERSFAVGVGQNMLLKCCSTCGVPCVNPLPCPGCSKMAKLLELSQRFFVDELGKPVPVTKKDFLSTCKILVNNNSKFIDTSYGYQVWELYPVKSLINHSCSPSMSSIRFGRESFWYAVRPIAAGEELTVSYFGKDDFSSQPKQQRNGKLLTASEFLCSCQACEENWPTLRYLPYIRWLCVKCTKPISDAGMQCNECLEKLRGKLDVKKASEKMMSALDFLLRMQSKVALGEPMSKQEFRHLCKSSEVIFKYSAMPSITLVGLMKLMEVCAGNGLMW
ncbi:uncharacterized protein LOC135202954 isoform X2 [Macrobrachium nipponense]|uniref:uncharacterized protein LOC135202954 isoform X2 n=1 Tax=Macrobrachium nipponense TaxID=159736 RepID=UPI0030C7B89F